MKEVILHYHSIFMFLVFGVVSVCTIFGFYNWLKGKPYTKLHEVLSRTNIGIVHSQMLLGIILMTHSANVNYGSNQPPNKITDYWSYAHPAIMMAGIILVTLSLILVRNKKTDRQKHKLTFLFNILALLLVSVGIVMKP